MTRITRGWPLLAAAIAFAGCSFNVSREFEPAELDLGDQGLQHRFVFVLRDMAEYELDCQSRPDRRDRIDDACTAAIGSLSFD